MVGARQPGRGDIGAGGGGKPVALVLEGVAGKVGLAGAACGVVGLPVHLAGAQEELAEGLCIGAALAQRRGEVCLPRKTAGGKRRQHRVRTELIELAHTLALQGRDAVGEAHGAAGLRDPVVGVKGLPQLACEVGDDRDLGLGVGELLADLGELIEHRLHERRVKGVTRAQPGGLASGLLPLFLQRLEQLPGAGEDAGLGSVDPGKRDPLRELELILVGGDREHRPATWKRAHELGAGSDQLCRVFE